MTPLDTAVVRRRFPGLASDWIFLDNAGGAQVLGTAIERVAAYLRETPVQTGASYAVSRQAQERLDAATAAVAQFINAAEPREIVFGPSSTSLLDRLARALRPQIRPGDEIVVTDADHEANIGPWRRLAAACDATIKIWPVNTESWRLELDDLNALLGPRTRLVCCTQATNILGTIEPVNEIARRVHAAGAQLVVDGVAFAPHRLVDVRAWDVDYYVFSCYKVFGPHIGVLYGKYARLLALSNLNHEYLPPDAIPYKLQPGAYSYELAYGMGAVPDYLLELGSAQDSPRARLAAAWERIAAHEAALIAPLLDYLQQQPGVRLIGPASADPALRLPIVSFAVAGRNAAEITRHADQYNIGIRHGHFHARRLIDKLDLLENNGVVRVSLAHYNTPEEITRLLNCLQAFFASRA